MKKKTVVDFFGGGRGARSKIARAIGISTAAVSKWPDDGDIPKGSAYLLAVLYPELIDRPQAGSDRSASSRRKEGRRLLAGC